MEFKESSIKGVFEITLSLKEDERGFFMRTYDDKTFKEKSLNTRWVQENHSFSKQKGVVRGLHFQFPPHGEAKLVRVVTGEIYIVLVDLRKGSSTIGKWISTKLSAGNRKMLYAPEGMAMGICTLTDNCTLLYKMGDIYSPEDQGAIKWDDPDIGVKWPVKGPVLSERDRNAMSFKEFMKKHRGL